MVNQNKIFFIKIKHQKKKKHKVWAASDVERPADLVCQDKISSFFQVTSKGE